MSSGKPATGYDFPTKRKYRQQLWNFVDKALKKTPIQERKVLCLDTSQGLECAHLIRLGYRPENILACNRNPAELAWLTRRIRSLGTVNVAGLELREVLRRIDDQQENGFKINAMNLDLTGPISQSVWGILDYIRSNLLHSGIVIAVSLLRGREQDDSIRDLLEKSKNQWSDSSKRRLDSELDRCRHGSEFAQETDALRIAWVHNFFISTEIDKPSITDSAWGIYRSSAGSQTMFWMGMVLHDITSEQVEIVKKYQEKIARCKDRNLRRRMERKLDSFINAYNMVRESIESQNRRHAGEITP